MKSRQTFLVMMLAVAGALMLFDAAWAAVLPRLAPRVAPIVKVPSAGARTTEPLVVRTPPPTSPNSVARPTPARPTPAKPKPTVTPKPTPTPPKPRPYFYSYSPPLTPEDALRLIRQDCKNILSIQDPATLVARCRIVSKIIVATTRYLKIIDQRNSTLDSYRFYFIDKMKVDGPGVDTDVFRATPMIPNVSAVSFAAHDGDVYLYSATVYDSKGSATTFPLGHLIEQNYPHEEICYLFFPTTVRSVVVKYEVKQTRRTRRVPRMTVFAGVAREEEHLKQALWFLHRARREVDQAMRNPAAASRFLNAVRQNLDQAAKRLIRFRVKRR